MTRVKAPVEDADNDVREDGTACHWLAQQQIESGGVWPWPLGEQSPNDRTVTEELVRVVEEYLDFIKSWRAGSELRVESPLPTGSVFPGTQDGTPDCYHVSMRSTRGRLVDLKAGFRPIEVWRNDQLVVYGWTLFVLFPHLTELEITIVQPRVAHIDGTIRTWIVTREEMRPLAEELQAAALLAHADDPMCTLSDACRNCRAAHACRTKQAAAGAAVDITYDTTPHELTPAELAYELSNLEAAAAHLEHRITGLTAQGESLIKRGVRIPGYALQRKATRNRFPDEKIAEIEQLGRLLSVDVHAPVKVRTPAQLRNQFPGLDIEAMYAERPTGELVLKAVDPQEALRAFTHRK